MTCGWLSPTAADWVDARCDIYPTGSDRLEEMVPCTFSQRQGFVGITLEDGTLRGPDGESQGLITYMRTDSVTLSADAERELRAQIGRQFGDEYVPSAQAFPAPCVGDLATVPPYFAMSTVDGEGFDLIPGKCW